MKIWKALLLISFLASAINGKFLSKDNTSSVCIQNNVITFPWYTLMMSADLKVYMHITP